MNKFSCLLCDYDTNEAMKLVAHMQKEHQASASDND